MAFKMPTFLKKMQLNSVDFVRRGANPEADIALYKSADDVSQETEPELETGYIDLAKAEEDLTFFTDMLGESFSSIMKDNTLSDDERLQMIEKSMNEFVDTIGAYISPLDTVDNVSQEVTKNENTSKGDLDMARFENVDKSLLNADEVATLNALIAKAQGEEFDKEEVAGGKVNPAKAKKEIEKEEGELPPEVKKALEEVAELKKSIEMKELETVAKKYEILGKKASETAQTLYDLKKSGESNYNAYVAAMDAQVDLVEKSGLFTEIGKSGNYNYTTVAKSEPETQIETIAKSYREKDPTMSYEMSIAKAWENNPQLFDAYEQGM